MVSYLEECLHLLLRAAAPSALLSQHGQVQLRQKRPEGLQRICRHLWRITATLLRRTAD
jgi:hypothetical protein